MSKNNFLLHTYFCKPLNFEEFKLAKSKYFESIDSNTFSLPSSNNLRQMITSLKRDSVAIGPYKNLSVFEILNRIGSDLVLLSGAEKLFNNSISTITPDTVELCMGNIAGYDIVINTIEGEVINGEAFNVAKSFCKVKLRSTIKKLLKDENTSTTKRAIIMINSDMEEFIRTYNNLQLSSLKINDFFIEYIYCEV